VHFGLNAPPVVTDDIKELAEDAGGETPDVASAAAGMVARFSPRSRVRDGEPITVAVDTTRLHVFDLGTGMSIW
jgi:multiple sugar transport system ATP-binding protein